MSSRRPQRRLTAWIALAAMAWLVLAPPAWHAVRSLMSPASPWLEVCSAAGPRATGDAAGTQAPDGPSGPMHHAGHCLCCSGAAVDLALAPPAPSTVPAAPRGVDWDGPRPVSHAGAFSWRAGQPRAPPAAA